MFLKIAREIAKPQIFAIMDLLKRSTGLSVSELARALKMSYMGVKQHCVEMEKKGLVDTWRRAGESGRPEKAYRLTAKASSFYPEAGNELTLEILHSVRQIYGPSAPDTLLSDYFIRKTGHYLQKIKGGSAAERAASFAVIRDREGHCSELENDPGQGCRIVEFHHPLKELIAAFPNIRQMETLMIEKILMTEVRRHEEHASGLIRVSWHITTAHPQALAS
ncbi:MAG: hypothetical protein V4726_11840 [Verrucomicrobiota bacterium]